MAFWITLLPNGSTREKSSTESVLDTSVTRVIQAVVEESNPTNRPTTPTDVEL